MSTTQTNGVFATAGSILATVTVSANAVTTAVGSLGEMAQVLALHSSKYLQETKVKLAAEAVQSEQLIILNTTHRMADEMNKIQSKLQANADLTTLYNTLLPQVQAAVDKALGRSTETAS